MRVQEYHCRLIAALVLAALTASAMTVHASEPLFDTWRGFITGSVDDAMFPSDGACADFNKDGFPDIAIVYWWQIPKLTVLLNNGDGSFSDPVHYPAEVAYFLETADFDGDTYDDIVVADHGNNGQLTTVSFYFNQGDGSFGPPETMFVGEGPRELAAADFDGDGDLDLVVALAGKWANPGTDVAVLYNDGTGGFSGPVTFLAGDPSTYEWGTHRPWKLTAGDLNGDTFPDVVVGHGRSFFSILLNDGAGGFLFPTTYEVNAGPAGIDNESAVALVDADHDEDLDVVFSNIYMRVYIEGDPGAVALLRNQGDGTLGPAEVIPLMSYSTGAADLEVADVTGDGWDDVILCWEGGGELGWGVLPADGAGGFGATRRYPTGDSPTAVCPVDADGDTDLDVLVPSRGSQMVGVHMNPGDGDFSSSPVYPIDGFKQRHMDAGDIDNDGDLDIAACGGNNGTTGWVRVLRNHGNGTFAPSEWYNSSNVGRNIKIRDLNGDNWLDLVWADDPDGPPYDFKTRLNNGNGTFGAVTNWVVGTCGTYDLQAFDVDGDDDLDILLAELLGCVGQYEHFIHISKNNGDGTFAPPYAVGDGWAQFAISAGDFNEDDKLDLAFTAPDGLHLLPGHGDGTYGASSSIPFPGVRHGIRVARFNEDDHDDIVIRGDSMWIFLGHGDGTFDAPVIYEVDPQSTNSMDVGDADGDGDTDIVLTNWYGNDVSVFLNRGDGTFVHERYGAAGQTVDVRIRDFTGDEVNDICVTTSGSHVPFGTFGAQVMSGTGLTASLEEAPGGSPVLLMSPAYPNPFAGSTTLSYAIPRMGTIRLSIFDVRGRRVRTLVDGERAAGRHNIVWDALDSRGNAVPAGIYFVRLDTRDRSVGRRLVRVR